MICAYTDFNVFRKDRIEKQGGGVAILFRKCLELLNIHIVLNEILVCDIYDAFRNRYRFALCYRPPYYDLSLATSICFEIEKYLRDQTRCIVLGDFNLPFLSAGKFTDAVSDIFDNTFVNLGLLNMHSFPTRNQNCLDIILTGIYTTINF